MREDAAVQQVFDQVLRFAQQAIAAIFQFVGIVWGWSIGEVGKVFQAPWQSWPLWKQFLLVLIAAGVVWALYRAIKELWEAGERALVAITGLLGAFVKTLPKVLLAGLIALGGIWILNNVDALQVPSALHLSKG